MIFFEVPVNQETRGRMLPGQEERSLQQQRKHQHDQQLSSQQGKIGEAESKTSRLLPPRQESSDSYTSNQSSSVGSSSVTTTSPPPPKPPRSSPEPNADVPAPVDSQYGSRGPPPGKAQPLPSRPEPPVVSRTTIPLFMRGPANVPRNDLQQQQQQHLSNHNRPSSDERGYAPVTPNVYSNPAAAARTNLPGAMTSTDRRSNSFRDFRPSQIERSAYIDVSDSADSGHQASSMSSRTPRGGAAGGGGQTSPQILLHPPTPIGRQGSQRAPQDEKERQRYPSADETPSHRSQLTSTEAPRTFSPVLSDRQYQQPISQVLTPNAEPSRGRDFIVDHRQLQNNHDDHDSASATRQPGSVPRYLPQPPTSNARIPTPQPNLSNSRSSSTAVASSAKNLSSSSFRSQADSRSRSGVRSGTSSPNTWDRMSHRRRETLPHIVHYLPPNTSSKLGKDGAGDPRHSSRATYIVDNGVRRRVITDPSGWETPATEREPSVPLQRFMLESTEPAGGLEKRGIKSSLPDVNRVRETTTCIPREQAFVLSQQRRDELRKEREERERETVVIRLADIKV